MTPGSLFAAILFSAIGMGAFVYGKRAPAMPPMIIGIVLMIYPYFVTQTLWLYIVGAALTGSLFVFRD